ncbi:hemagglutinin repeat-containing protein [Stenotrophomonas sp. PS02289]|uniref:hemagglutinin repeat-containing protein n=1 Tax=Stenotrophomonas sp. PS02289 TaxID=2991422 RepID=UPI00249B6746|nr:hemagglutinin repeat-containing protein [Stenotrophomonas sp. PS02289]
MNFVYRLVFNRTLRVWQVASELVTRAAGGNGRAPRTTAAALTPLGFALMCSLGWVSVLAPAGAQDARIVADPNAPGRERPQVLTAPNGAPLVNITTPSAGGVSRNRYSQFDVGPEGAILNNARGQTQTQLGGWVQGNPWLATGAAKVILNEVNGPASRLNGYIEVAGQRAEVVIANPAGIQVNGGGFLNASRVTLTTGTPVFTGGVLDGYRVGGGAIQIEGEGLDTSRADYTDLITRSLQVNAGVWANQLTAQLGTGTLSAAGASALTAEAGTKPTFALDVGALGGMYANKIWLVGNEHGVGVRNAGTLGAQAGELVVTVDGRLENTGALQSLQNVRLNVADDVRNAGTIAASREVALNAAGTLDNSGGTVNAQRLQVDAGGLRNHGGKLEQTGVQALSLQTGALSNRSDGLVGSVITPPTPMPGGEDAGGNSGGTPSDPDTDTGSTTPGTGTGNEGSTPGTGTGTTPTTPVQPLAEGAINIAGLLDNDGGKIVNGGDTRLRVLDGLDNSGGRMGVNRLRSDGNLLNDGGTLHVYGDALLQLGQLSNQAGKFNVSGTFSLEATSFNNAGGELLHGGTTAASWNVRGLLDNSDGLISSNATSLLLSAQDVNNSAGRIEHAGLTRMLLSSQQWSGAGGSISTAGALDWSADRIDMQGGKVTANRFQITSNALDNRGGSLLSLGAPGSSVRTAALDNREGGTIAANGELTVATRTLDNREGLIQQAGNGALRIGADTLSGAGGKVLSNGALSITGGDIDLSKALTSGQQVSIDANTLRNNDGELYALGGSGLQLSARDLLDNSGGTLSANGNVKVQAGQLLNVGGNVLAAEGGRLDITTLGLLDNSSNGRLAASGNITLDAGTLLNRSGAIEHAGTGTLSITAGTLDGQGGRILGMGSLDLRGGTLTLGEDSTTQAERIRVTATDLSTAGGTLSATGSEALQLHLTGTLDNREGTVATNGALDLQAANVHNQKGTLSAASTEDSRWTITDTLDNSEGTLASNAGTLDITAGQLINTDGTLSHAGDTALNLHADRIDGNGGTLVSKAVLSVQADVFNHSKGTLGADSVDLHVGTLDNSQGQIVASGTAASQVRADTLINAGGTLASNGDLRLQAELLNNTDGRIQHAGDGTLQIDATTLQGARGSIVGNGMLALTGQALDLSGATTSARAVSIDAASLNNAGGTLAATGDQALHLTVQGTLDNRAGSIGSNGLINLSAQQLLNQQGNVQAAGTSASTVAVQQALDNQQGKILLAGTGTVSAAQLDNRGGTVHAGGSSLTLSVDGKLDNSASGLLSSAGAMDLDANLLDNQGGGTVVAGSTLDITTAQALNNAGGALQSTGALTIDAAGLNNQSGSLIGGSVNIETHGNVLNNRNGTLGSQTGALDIRSGDLDNTGGRLQSQGGMTVNVGGGTLTNTASPSNGGILSGGTLRVDGAVLNNQGGTVVAQGDTTLVLGSGINNSATGTLMSNANLTLQSGALNNAGGRVQAAQNLGLTLTGALNNQAGAVAAGQALTINASSVDNSNTRSGALGLQAGSLQLTTQTLNNANGQLITDGDAHVQLTGALDNTAGQITTGGSLNLGVGSTLNNQSGLLRADLDQILVATALNGNGQIHAQRDLSLTLQHGLTNTGEWVANRTLALYLGGDLDNQGILRAGNLDLNAHNINNSASGEITSQGVTHLNASGTLTNRGLIDGTVTHLEAGTLDNLGTGRIYGDHVAINAGTLTNHAETLNGVTKVGTIAARERLDIGAGQLTNTDKGLIYSGGSAAIGGSLGADRLATGTAQQINNLGATIDVAGDLSINTLTLNNVRENVAVAAQQVKSIDETVNLTVASWQKNGSNTGTLNQTSNYKAYEYFYIAPGDVVEDTPYITPSGEQINRAVLRITEATTRYYYAYGGLGNKMRGERWRMDPDNGTITIYYLRKDVGAPNPDQVAGVADPVDGITTESSFRYDNDRLTYDGAYGTCSSDCIRFIAPLDYDPNTTILMRRQHPEEYSLNEQNRISHHVAYDDVLQAGAGADSVIRSGGNMHLAVNDFNNLYAQIAAGGNLAIIGHGIESRVNNVGLALYRTHTFNNTSITYNRSQSQWTATPISEKIGQLGGTMIAGGTLTIDVGDLSNLNQGRDAPNVKEGAALGNLSVRGPQAAAGGNASNAQGPGQTASSSASAAQAANATAAGTQQGGQVGGNGTVGGSRVVQAAGNSPDRIAMGTPDVTAPSGSIFNVNPNSGSYLVETDPRFTDRQTWLSSDYLLKQMGFSADALQKRLGDGYYEQKLIREQIGELTGRRFLEGYASDEAQYQSLLDAGATVAKEWNLRPGVALTEAQMAQLTSDIVWLVEQTITLADGSSTKALVPQVYLRLRDGDIDPNGAVLAGANVDITLNNGLVNSGNIAGRKLVTIDAGKIEHLGGTISGAQVGLSSATDIKIEGATVTATDALSVQAQGNITVASTVETLSGGGATQYNITQTDRVAGLYVTSPTGLGVLSVAAGGDISLQGAQIRNAGTEGITQLAAGGNLELGAQTLGHSTDTTHDDRNFQRSSTTTHAVSSVQGAGDVVLSAGKDLTLVGSKVDAGQALVMQAGGDITSKAVVDSTSSDFSAAGKRNSLTISRSDETVRGSQLSAGSDVMMVAGRDVNLTAAQVASDDGTVLVSAGRDVNLLSTQENHDYSFDSYQKKKGTFSSTTTTRTENSHDSYAVGTVIEGEAIDISAGRDLTAVGAVLDATGNVSLGAGNNVLITAAEDTHNSSSSQTSKKSGFSGGFANGVASVGYNKASSNSSESVQSTTQVGSAIASREGNVLISAGNQLTLAASDVAAGEDLTLVGKDIALLARQDTVDTQGTQSSKSSGFSMGITYDPTKAYRSARDSTTDGMGDSGTIMGDITRNAEGTASGVRAATTSTVITGGSQRSNGSQTHSTSDARVSQLAAGGDLTLIANGGSITSQGAQMSAEGNAVLLATKNINFEVAHNTETSTSESSAKGWGFANNTSGLPFGTNNSRSEGSGSSDTITGTQLSVGGGVRMATTEGDITLTAANIAAEKDVNIRAAGNLLVQSGQDTVANANTADSKAIGTVQISDTEKFSGWHRQQHDDDSGMVSQVASTIGSLGGNVNLGAGGKYTQIASNVVAAQDVNITAAEIELLTADETGHNSQSDKDLKIGVFARIKSPFIDLINNVDAARQSDGRLQAMQGMAAGANAYQAGSAIASAVSKGAAGSGSLFSAEAGIGFKQSSSSAEGSSTVSRGSTIQGGGNVNLTSTSGDIHIVQGNLSAGTTLSLDSARDILLEAGKAHMQDKSKSSNSGAEVGVGVSVGAQTGVYVYAEASVGSSKSNSDSSTWQNTELTGKNISLKAEGDTTLRGATATADRIDVKTGGTLTIESLQDIAESMSKDSQVGGRVQVSFGTAWDVSGYASASKANGSYKGVGQQSGLFAGEGGYHVDATHVNLIGGAIASTNAANSELTADTLTFTDLQNEMKYRASSASISGGFGFTGTGQQGPDAPSAGSQLKDIGNTISTGNYGKANSASFSPGVPITESGSDSSTTYATLTEGNITIGGKKTTAAELGLNTDAAAAHQAIETLPDLQKLIMEQQALAAATGTVVDTGLRIRADINQSIDEATTARDAARERLNDPDADLSAQERATLEAQGMLAQKEINRLQKVGLLVGAITGGISASSGTTGGIVAGTLAPAISFEIGQYFKENSARNATEGAGRAGEGSATHLLAHALLGAAVASAGGDSALVGALAAGSAEAAAPSIAKFLFGKDSADLTAAEKDTVSAIAGMGGALTGSFRDGLVSAAVGAGAAKNAIDNNWGEVGHYSTMATILYLTGFREDIAKGVALAAWGPDTDSRNAITVENILRGNEADMPQKLNHLLTGLKDAEKVKVIQKYFTDQASLILADIKANEDNPVAVRAILNNKENQRILHALGDSFAHVKTDGTHFDPVIGHAFASKYQGGVLDPDNPYSNRGGFAAYGLAIYNIATATSKKDPLRNSDYIADLVMRVSSVKDEGQQKGILDAAASFFMPTRTSGLVNSPVGECGIWCAAVPDGYRVKRQLEIIFPNKVQVPLPPVIDWSKFYQMRW